MLHTHTNTVYNAVVNNATHTTPPNVVNVMNALYLLEHCTVQTH